MTEKTQEWAERVGREAVALGLAPTPGLMAMRDGDSFRLSIHFGPWADFVPDFRDRLTELAAVAWVEDVAREVYGEGFEALRPIIRDGSNIMSASYFNSNRAQVTSSFRMCDTLAEACIAAVRAMKGGE